jgi:hypothetical protein
MLTRSPASTSAKTLAGIVIELTERDLAELAKAFPPPKRRRPLEVL